MDSTKKAKQNEETIAAYVGLDWADSEHEVTMLVVETGEVETRKLKQESEALAEWVQSLQERFSGRKVAIAVEQTKGALIYALMCYDFLNLYPVNPKTLARFREAFNTSGAKSDPSDSGLLLDLIRLHRDKLRAWVPEDADTRLLQMLVEERRSLVDDVTGLTNRLGSTLKQYFPQALEWAGELNSRQALDFLTRWPTLQSIRKAGAAAVEKFYRQHGLRNKDKVEQRVKAIKESRALTTDRAVVEGSKMKALATVRQLHALAKSIAEMDARIQELFEQHRDHEVFSSFPCAKKVLGPRLLAAFGRDRSRYEAALDLQSLSGIAPVTRSSGKSKTIHKRLACPKFLRQTFHEYAAQSIKKAGWARVYYRAHRDKGVKHHAAVRALAYKWIRIMFKCWQEQEPYNEAKYVASLKRRSSPLVPGLLPAPNALV